jgi:hypothetical protein
MKLLVCIPFLSCRGQYLANTIRSYERHTDCDWQLSLVTDAPSAGEGWNRCAEQGLEWWPDATHLHFSNDDVAVGPHWLPPMVEATDAGCIPCMRIEPASRHMPEEHYEEHPTLPYEEHPVPRDKVAYFFAGHDYEQPAEDWAEVPHGNLPFCTTEQWREVGPFPPMHYGTDCFFYKRAKALGYRSVARQEAVAFNYNAQPGRSKGDWTEQDFLDFDGIIAQTAYERGDLPITEAHPLRLTPEGLAAARKWRHQHEEAGG